eukprot:SAG31_NODE_6210_length_2120_cov_1.196932_2_plen_199_part_00
MVLDDAHMILSIPITSTHTLLIVLIAGSSRTMMLHHMCNSISSLTGIASDFDLVPQVRSNSDQSRSCHHRHLLRLHHNRLRGHRWLSDGLCVDEYWLCLRLRLWRQSMCSRSSIALAQFKSPACCGQPPPLFVVAVAKVANQVDGNTSTDSCNNYSRCRNTTFHLRTFYLPNYIAWRGDPNVQLGGRVRRRRHTCGHR